MRVTRFGKRKILQIAPGRTHTLLLTEGANIIFVDLLFLVFYYGVFAGLFFVFFFF
jgi:hypothetical protein